MLLIEKQNIEKSLNKYRVEHTFIYEIVKKHPDVRIFCEKYDKYILKK